MADIYLDDKAYYNEVYRVSELYNKPPQEVFYYPIWLKILHITQNTDEIYEIGCGSGQLANMLLSAGRNYVTGWDYAEEAIKLAHKLNPDHKDKFVCRDLYTFRGFKEGITVISTEVLEHLDDDAFLIRLLPKGTRFIFSVPNYKAAMHKRIYPTLKSIRTRYRDLKILNHWRFDHVPNQKFIYLVDSIKK